MLSTLSNTASRDVHFTLQNRRLSNTGSWFLENFSYRKWRNGKPSTLWCPGLAGAGKTFLASNIIDDLHTSLDTSNTAIVYVYARHDQQHEQQVSSILASFCRQLVEAHNDQHQRTRMITLIQQRLRCRNSRSAANLEDLVLQLANYHSRLFIIVDALDEVSSKSNDILNVARALVRLQARADNLHLCITSRENRVAQNVICPDYKIQVEPSPNDIEVYVCVRMEQSHLLCNWSRRDPEIASRIVETIRLKSNSV